MTSSLRRRVRGAAVALAAAATVLTTGAFASPASAATPASATPRNLYVSLGDSLAFGYQPDLVALHAPASAFHSYAEDFVVGRPDWRLVNFGCPGETTATMISGGCPWLAAGGPLHDSYGSAPSQLAAALALLQQRHGHVKQISIDIGSNDLIADEAACGSDLGCLLQHIGNPAAPAPGTLFGNLAAILTAVRTAAPTTRILVFNYYNPEAIAAPQTDALLQPINAALVPFTAAFGAHVVDAFGAINRRYAVDGQVSGLEYRGICQFTWMCTTTPNIHPNDTGYFRMMQAMWTTIHAS